MPQDMIVKAQYFAIGSLWRSRVVGYSQAKYPESLLVCQLRCFGDHESPKSGQDGEKRHTEKEYTAQPLVIVANQVYIFSHSHCIRIC